MARLFRMIDPGFLLRDRVDDRHLSVVGNALDGLNRRQAGKTLQVTDRNHLLLDMIDVVSDEAAPPFVENQTEPAAGMIGRGEGAARGIEAEIKIPDIKGKTGFAR